MFPLHLLFSFTLVLGSLIVINSSSWFVAWVGLEVNLLSILPLMASEKNKSSSESCLKYFLVQSMASLLILISSIFVFSTVLFDGIFVIFIGLAIKLGVAPFHYWFPSVMEGVKWSKCVILMTWQKLAPLFLVEFTKIILMLVVTTALIGAFGGFGQNSLSKILAFSSIGHVGWMLAGILKNFKVGLVYFFVYSFLTLLIVATFMILKLFTIEQLNLVSYSLKLMILVGFLSLGGLPPFLGFFPKWMVIEELLWSSLFLASFLIFSSLVNLYYYMRVCYGPLTLQFLGGEGKLGGTLYAFVIFAFLFFSSGGVFCYPLLSCV